MVIGLICTVSFAQPNIYALSSSLLQRRRSRRLFCNILTPQALLGSHSQACLSPGQIKSGLFFGESPPYGGMPSTQAGDHAKL